MSMLMPPYTAAFHDYLRRELGYRSDAKYEIFGGIGKWDWGGNKREGFPDTGDALRDAMHKNPYMKVFVASGYFDLATPYFATEYTFRHMGLDPEVRGNFEMGYYEAGHMMYVHEDYLRKLRVDIERFVTQTKGR
jgi:carboxypeptidase C (cathepsin A)